MSKSKWINQEAPVRATTSCSVVRASESRISGMRFIIETFGFHLTFEL